MSDENASVSKEVEDRVSKVLDPKLKEIDQTERDIIANVKKEGDQVSTLEDIIAIDSPKDDQGKYNSIEGIKKQAKKLQEERKRHLFFKKTDDQVVDYFEQSPNQSSLEECAKKVFLYRELGFDVEADLLQKKLKNSASKLGVRKETFENTFTPNSKDKTSSDDLPEFEVYGYDDQRAVWLGYKGQVERIAATSLKKELAVIFGPDVPMDLLLKEVHRQSSLRGKITERRILKQGIYRIEKKWIIISGKKAISIDEKKEKEKKKEITDPLFGKYFIVREGDKWIDLDQIGCNTTTPEECLKQIVAIIEKWRWADKEVINYVAAFLMLTPFQQAMHWRPILYLSGEKGTGKTSFSHLLEQIFSGLFERVDKTTAHALKQTFGDNSKVAFLDEFEHYKSDKQQKDILNLLKTTCRGGKVSFGTTGKNARECHLHHLFLIASISFPKCIETDSAIQDRLIILPLKKEPLKYTPIPPRNDLVVLLSKIINTVLWNWDEIEKRVDHFLQEKNMIAQCKKYKVEARQVENFLWASALISLAKKKPIEQLRIIPAWAIKTPVNDSERILEEILSTGIGDSCGKEHIIFDLLDRVFLNRNSSNTGGMLEDAVEEAKQLLRNKYITLTESRDPKQIYMAIQKSQINHFFSKNTAYAGMDINTILGRLPGVKITRARFGEHSFQAILIPYDKIKEIFKT